MMDKMKIEEIFSDKEFVKELVALKDNAAVQAALKEKGLDLTEEQIAAIRESMTKKTSELSAEQLEQVSGGVSAEHLEQIESYGSIAAGALDMGDDLLTVVKDQFINALKDLFTW
jgi:hypothetical protein